MIAAFERHKPMLEGVTPSRLVHWDYHFENILQQAGRITGIIDFEWSLSGDPNYDFKLRDQWESDCPGSRDLIYRGYTDHNPLPADHELRVTLYSIMMNLDYLVDGAIDAQQVEALSGFQKALKAVEES